MIPYKISIVIPLYNKGPHISRAINSVLSQTYQNFEILIIDGHSSDNGPKEVKRYNDFRISFYIQEGKGVSCARNQGIQKSRSEFIVFLDADDEWLPNHLQILVRLKEKYPMAGAYSTAYKICNSNQCVYEPNIQGIPPKPWEGLIPNYFKSGVLGQSPIYTSSIGIPKQIFLKLGGFPEGENWGEDLDMWGRIALNYPIAFSWEIGSIYHEDSVNRITNSINLVEEQPFIKTAKQNIIDNKILGDSKFYLEEYIVMKEIETAYHQILGGNLDYALDILNQYKTLIFRSQKLKLKLYIYFLKIKTFLIKKLNNIN